MGAAAEQIKSLIKSFSEGDDARFYSTAMQIAASEAQKGHSNVAKEIRDLIDRAKEERSVSALRLKKTIPLAAPRGELSELLEVFYPKVKLVDMILSPELETSLNRIVTEHRKHEVLIKHNLHPRRKLLLTGKPGCGKTKTAQALAGELGLAVFIVRLDGLITKFMGESISKLRLIFDAMHNTRGVYLFDEFDSIGSNRSYGNDVGEIKRVLNSFLLNIEKDESQSIIIAATNIPEALDTALFRRFDDIIEYPLPGRKELEITFRRNLEGFKLREENLIEHLVQEAEGLSYADVIRSCQEAIKDMLINGMDSISENLIVSYLTVRKLNYKK